MHRVNYKDLIKQNQNESTIKLIGKIDCNSIDSNIISSLFYIFPLIERMVLEIYKLLPLSDIEYYDQGIMRSILEIIKKDKNNYIPKSLIAKLDKYFGEKGLRNKLFHVYDDVGRLYITNEELNYDELKSIIYKLLLKLREVCNNNVKDYGKIELIK